MLLVVFSLSSVSSFSQNLALLKTFFLGGRLFDILLKLGTIDNDFIG